MSCNVAELFFRLMRSFRSRSTHPRCSQTSAMLPVANITATFHPRHRRQASGAVPSLGPAGKSLGPQRPSKFAPKTFPVQHLGVCQMYGPTAPDFGPPGAPDLATKYASIFLPSARKQSGRLRRVRPDAAWFGGWRVLVWLEGQGTLNSETTTSSH